MKENWIKWMEGDLLGSRRISRSQKKLAGGTPTRATDGTTQELADRTTQEMPALRARISRSGTVALPKAAGSTGIKRGHRYACLTGSWLSFWVVLATVAGAESGPAQVRCWVTDLDHSSFFEEKSGSLPFGESSNTNQTITVDDSASFQSIDGFGCCLTGGSAGHLMRMEPAHRAALLRELFDSDGTNIGMSYLRVSIGSSDLDAHTFSYDDLPGGETDANLLKFSLARDREAVIPVLKEILAIFPKLLILGSPWSAPAWMKDNDDTRGGRLLPQFYAAYAKYFVNYIEGMKAEGIRIDAITVQNEPLNPNNNPSMVMQAPEEGNFIKNDLGPAFRDAGLDTKIMLYDHNCDHPEYPISILNDPAAKKFVDGSAFHLYGGQISAMSAVHQAHPSKGLYFTEQWMGAHSNPKRNLEEHMANLVIGATRNWSRNVLEWNLSSDADYQPHTDRGGCDSCQGVVTIDGNKVTRNAGYYVLAHAAKFVRPGSVRIASNYLTTLPNVAFKAPDGRKVLVVLNKGTTARRFNIREKGRQVECELNGGAVATYVW